MHARLMKNLNDDAFDSVCVFFYCWYNRVHRHNFPLENLFISLVKFAFRVLFVLILSLLLSPSSIVLSLGCYLWEMHEKKV